MARSPRKRCKNPDCREWFEPKFSNQTWCSPECGAVIALAAREKQKVKAQAALKVKARESEKQDRAQMKERKLSVKPLSHWHKLAQQAFNAYIRERDAGQPCISCGKPDNGEHQRHASHFKSVGACRELRYDEFNVHAACSVCNNHMSGNIAGYTPALLEKIGQAEFDRINGPQKIRKWDRESLEELAAHYREKTRKLIKARNESHG